MTARDKREAACIALGGFAVLAYLTAQSALVWAVAGMAALYLLG
jgi:hypothetical protein